MSLPNNGNGFGANSASLVAYRTRDTLTSAENFQHLAEHSGVNQLKTYAILIPAGTAVTSRFDLYNDGLLAVVGAYIKGSNSNTTYSIRNQAGAQIMFFTGSDGSFVTTTPLAASPTAVTGITVVTGGAAVGATDVEVVIVGYTA